MRRVPENKKLLLVGDGRLARHLARFLSLYPIELHSWNRRSNTINQIKELSLKCDGIILALADQAIVPFYQQHRVDGPTYIHCSGSLYHPSILDFHPLMTFSHELYPVDVYKKIHFVGTSSLSTFKKHLPFSDNPYSQIEPQQKSLYHSLCVLSGNGSTLLWEKVSQSFKQLGIPQQALAPYLTQIFNNIASQQKGRFTGPWYRDDKQTIEDNRLALKQSPLLNLYNAMENLSHSLRGQQ